MQLWFLGTLLAALPSPSLPAALGVMASTVGGEAAQTATRPVLTVADVHGSTDARATRLLALHVAAGEPPTPFLEPGRFTARFSAQLVLPLRTKLRFRAVGTGTVRLTIDDDVLLEATGNDLASTESESKRIGKGANPLLLEFESPAEGSAAFRLEWAGRDFEWEPIPPSALVGPEQVPAGFAASAQLRRGRTQFAGSRCIACHQPEAGQLTASSFPELAADAPALHDAGARFKPDFLHLWLTDPRAVRPQAQMPRVTHLPLTDSAHGDPQQRVADLVAYLGTLTGDEALEAIPAITPAEIQAGGALFADLGCIACHHLPHQAPSGVADDERIALGHVAGKWMPAALADFLVAPHQRYQWIRMPDLDLSAGEAAALSAFLLHESAAPSSELIPADAPVGDAERGRRHFLELGCRNCHEAPIEASVNAPALSAIAAAPDQGCVAGEENSPDFGFTDDQRADLAAFLRDGLPSLSRQTVSEFAERQIASLRCSACHSYDDAHDQWAGLAVETLHLQRERVVDEEHPELDQARPPLTWVGEKLHSAWIEDLLAGRHAQRARPWLYARMPAFPVRAALLAEGLAAVHGLSPSHAQPATVDDQASAAGRQLIGETGFSCHACHGIGEQPPLSQFEFGTPNLELAHERIRPGYFARWMYDPMRVDPTSKMPRYADDDGLSPFTDSFDGDIRRQYEAIRLYLATIRRSQREPKDH